MNRDIKKRTSEPVEWVGDDPVNRAEVTLSYDNLTGKTVMSITGKGSNVTLLFAQLLSTEEGRFFMKRLEDAATYLAETAKNYSKRSSSEN